MLFAIPDNRKSEEVAGDVDEGAEADAPEDAEGNPADLIPAKADGQLLEADPKMDAEGAAKIKAAEEQAKEGTGTQATVGVKQSDPQAEKTSTPETDPKTGKKNEPLKEPAKKPVVTFGSGGKPGKGN